MTPIKHTRDKVKNYLHRHPGLLHLYWRVNPLITLVSLRDGYKIKKHENVTKMIFQTIISQFRTLPDFVIIGAKKSSTTSLYDFVTAHPNIAPALKKEVRFFSGKPKHGELMYRANFPTNLSKRRFCKKTNQRLVTGEAGPGYLFHPAAPIEMKEILPDVKLIVILRNPVDRAYSDYWNSVRGYQESLSFEKAIELEEERCAEGEVDWGGGTYEQQSYFHSINRVAYSYLARGLYADQPERWFRYYKREQFLIIAAEDLAQNPQQSLNQFFDFVGVRPFQVKILANSNVGSYKKMDGDTRKFLVEYFRPHNRRLYNLLQRDFNWDV